MEDLKYVAKALRTLPFVDTRVPTLALVGAPNVGKSSLVQVRRSKKGDLPCHSVHQSLTGLIPFNLLAVSTL